MNAKQKYASTEKKTNEYASYGTEGHTNVFTGQHQNVEINSYIPTDAVSFSIKGELDIRYSKIIATLPEIIDLSKFKDGQYEHEEEVFKPITNKEDLYNVSYGTLIKIKKYISESTL